MNQPPTHPARDDLTGSTPYLDPAWREAFVLEQRLAGVSGEQIGDALATIEEHCAASGETAAEAFGDPAGYARALLLPQRPAVGISARTALGLVCGLAALVLLPRAVDGGVEGAAVPVTVGDLVALGLCLALAALVMARPEPVIGWVARHRASIVVLPFAVLLAFVAPMVLWRGIVAEPAWVPMLAAGLLLLVLSVALTWADPAAAPDPIRDPRRKQPRTEPRPWLLALLFPFLTVVVLGMEALIRAIG